MRTFEEVKDNLKSQISAILKATIGEIEYDKMYNKKQYEKDQTTKIIGVQKMQSYLDNIDEVTIIRIGNDVNRIIEQFQNTIKTNPLNIYNNFYSTVQSWYMYSPIVLELHELDLKLSDFECFRTMNYTEAVNKFIELMNVNFGTNIPLPGAVDEALNEYYEKTDEQEKAQAFMRLRELQRDSGLLEHAGDFTLLNNDKAYQQAKEICSSKTYL